MKENLNLGTIGHVNNSMTMLSYESIEQRHERELKELISIFASVDMDCNVEELDKALTEFGYDKVKDVICEGIKLSKGMEISKRELQPFVLHEIPRQRICANYQLHNGPRGKKSAWKERIKQLAKT